MNKSYIILLIFNGSGTNRLIFYLICGVAVFDVEARCGDITTLLLFWGKPRSHLPWKNISRSL